jgi:hypothetical protein
MEIFSSDTQELVDKLNTIYVTVDRYDIRTEDSSGYVSICIFANKPTLSKYNNWVSSAPYDYTLDIIDDILTTISKIQELGLISAEEEIYHRMSGIPLVRVWEMNIGEMEV